MVKDISASKRAEYVQQIAAVENQAEELRAQQNKLLEALETLGETSAREFQKLVQIQEKQAKAGSVSARWRLEETQAKAQHLKKLVSDGQEELESVSSKASQDLEDKRSQLQKQRDALPWEESKPKDAKE